MLSVLATARVQIEKAQKILSGLRFGRYAGPQRAPCSLLLVVLFIALAAVFGVAATFPVVLLSTRYRTRIGGVVEKIAYAGYALPGIVVALALVFFGANYAPALYQTLVLLIFAYVILFLPQAMGALRSSLLQLGPNIEEAGLTLGCSRWRVLYKLTLPLIRPGILTALALVFLTTMKELPATLLLSPTGFRTLTTEIWNATTEAFYTRAAGPALLLVVLSTFSLWILFSQEDGSIH